MELYTIQFSDPLGQLFEWVSEIQKLVISVLDIVSLGLDNCLQPSRHTFDYLLTPLALFCPTSSTLLQYLESSTLIYCQR